MKHMRLFNNRTKKISRVKWYEDNCWEDYKYWLTVGLTVVNVTNDGDDKESIHLCRKYVKRKYKD